MTSFHEPHFRAFLECSQPVATKLVSLADPTTIAAYQGNKPCFTKLGNAYAICDRCAAFWETCSKNNDETTRSLAVYLRQAQELPPLHNIG
jgi:hypothetical protein